MSTTAVLEESIPESSLIYLKCGRAEPGGGLQTGILKLASGYVNIKYYPL